MVRLLIKRLFGEICPREAYIEEINAWVDCDKDRTIGENLMQLSEKYMIYKQRVRDGQMGITPQFWMIYLILWRSSITSILQCKRAILIGECVRGSSSCRFTFPPTSTTMSDMAAGMCIKWETEIHYTVAPRSSSLFDRKHDTTSKQLLISEENNHWIRMPKPKAVLEDSVLTMMQSLSGRWEGLTKSEI